ncbi:PP2C family protein-serine/threonine phosphatase [Nakamurella sp. GG22]
MTEPGIVLVVEDDSDLGAFLREALRRRLDQPVLLASDGREALRILQEKPVDVLVTDIQMPGMTGLELVENIRRTQPALPIIMMTAHASVDYAVSALRHQVDEFLVKPVAAAELVPKVRALAERGAAARLGARALADIDPATVDANDVTRLERQMLMDLAAVMGQQISLSQQLDRAAQVQRDLLPHSAPVHQGYDLAAVCVPSFAVGGDFYDWYPLAVNEQDGVDFTVADVMGKGIPAALVTATVRAVMRGVDRGRGPAAALRAAATSLAGDLEETGTFVTVFHGSLCTGTGVLTYADAGHGLTLHVRADGSFTQLVGQDLPLGVFEGDWSDSSITLEPGDWLVCFSDGLFDLLGGTSDAFEDVAAIVRTSADCSQVMRRITDLTGSEVLIDDVTVVAMRRR